MLVNVFSKALDYTYDIPQSYSAVLLAFLLFIVRCSNSTEDRARAAFLTLYRPKSRPGAASALSWRRLHVSQNLRLVCCACARRLSIVSHHVPV